MSQLEQDLRDLYEERNRLSQQHKTHRNMANREIGDLKKEEMNKMFDAEEALKGNEKEINKLLENPDLSDDLCKTIKQEFDLKLVPPPSTKTYPCTEPGCNCQNWVEIVQNLVEIR